MDRSKLATVGRPALKEFLIKLQVCCLANGAMTFAPKTFVILPFHLFYDMIIKTRAQLDTKNNKLKCVLF